MKIRMFPALVVSAAALLLLSGGQVLAQVQSPGPGASSRSDPPRDQPFGTLDSDGDGALSQDEFGGVSGLSFETVDKDGDRRITADEYREARVQRDTRDPPSDTER